MFLTHNFEFFNLVKVWFQRKNKKDTKLIPCEFFMIKNKNGKCCASIVPLDETLQKFKSEYHFLFSKLNHFVTDEAPEDYEDSYTIGNIARRFLEIYTHFKIPTTGDLKSRLDDLETPGVTHIEKDTLYKLVQESSHGFDPVSAIEHKDKSEIKNAIEILIRVVKESDKKHFECLGKSLLKRI